MENHIEIEAEKQDKGFTLVELLIVIVILGILATVTVFAVTGITNRGKTSACQADKTTIQTAEEAYSANTGTYSVDAAAVVGPPAVAAVNGQQALVDAGLMHSVSANFTIQNVPAVGLKAASYTLTGASTTCTALAFPAS
jgi:prepilin-type N-terminal cleavage/methylation domain-containing protein